MNFWDELKYSFKGNNNFKILIYLNLIVFVVILLTNALAHLFKNPEFNIIKWVAISANPKDIITKPWTIITYMFAHEQFLHILFNLLIFYSFGKLFLQYLSQRQLLGTYILGGLTGALFYLVAYSIFPILTSVRENSWALGASASVMAIVIAIATLVPNQRVYLLFFGQIKLMYIAITVIIIDLIGIVGGNSGGHIAHLGGALLGYIFVAGYKKGKDITIWISRILNGIKEFFKPTPKIKIKINKKKQQHKRPETDMEYNARKKTEQDKIDKILEKIAQSGYSSLTPEEKADLFKMSNKR
jgi:membrane associated rhomboid family serine protease